MSVYEDTASCSCCVTCARDNFPTKLVERLLRKMSPLNSVTDVTELSTSASESSSTRTKVQLPPRLADDHKRVVPRQGDAVGATEAVEHDGRLTVAWVVPQEAAGGAGL